MVTTGTVEAQLAQPSPGVTDAVLLERAWRALSTVMDPEVPVVSIVELGIVRDVPGQYHEANQDDHRADHRRDLTAPQQAEVESGRTGGRRLHPLRIPAYGRPIRGP